MLARTYRLRFTARPTVKEGEMQKQFCKVVVVGRQVDFLFHIEVPSADYRVILFLTDHTQIRSRSILIYHQLITFQGRGGSELGNNPHDLCLPTDRSGKSRLRD